MSKRSTSYKGTLYIGTVQLKDFLKLFVMDRYKYILIFIKKNNIIKKKFWLLKSNKLKRA